jgi:hypothetical protein
MDPDQLAIVLGLLTNGIYSLILLTGSKVKEIGGTLHSEKRLFTSV